MTMPMRLHRRRLLVALFLAVVLLLLARRRRRAAVRSAFRAALDASRASEDVTELRAHASLQHVALPEIKMPKEIDVVISGGGFWSIYAGAVCFVLRQHGIVIRRLAGTSAGAHTALLVHQGNDAIDEGFLWAIAVTETVKEVGAHTFLEDLWTLFFRERASPPPRGELTVGISEASGPPRLLRHQRVDHFEDGEHLLDALVATARIPGFFGLARQRARQHHRFAVDGGATEMCPLFADGARPQLVLYWDELRARYHGLSGFGLPSKTIFELGYLGVDAACRLLRGETSVLAATLMRPSDPPPRIASCVGAVYEHLAQSVRQRVASRCGWYDS